MKKSLETTNLAFRDGDDIALSYLAEHEDGFHRGFPCARLDRLAKMGMVEKMESSYRITPAGRAVIEAASRP